MQTYKRLEEVEFKNKKFDVELEYYYDEDLEEYYVDQELGDKNLRLIRNEYRKRNGLLLDYNIKQIRERYGLSQKDFAILLGFGEVTITRYESKTVQDKAQDEIIRNAKNPNEFLRMAQKNKGKYIEEYNEIKFLKVLDIIQQNICSNYVELEYTRRNFPANIVGFEEVHLDKIYSLIKYFSEKMNNLTKTKLAKLFWYVDFLSYKTYGHSMTGLAYCHLTHGAVPFLYEEFINDKRVKSDVIYFDDSTKFLITGCECSNTLSNDEKNLIDLIVEKFKDMNTKQVVDYMHNESAYLKTKDNEFICYKYAEEIEI